jgi:hypothetical protein
VAVVLPVASVVSLSTPAFATTGTAPLMNAAGQFVPLTPVKVLDTRSGLGAPTGPVAANTAISVQLGGVGGVPASGVSAVVLNVSAISPTTNGWIDDYPSDMPDPGRAAEDFQTGQNVNGTDTIELSATGAVSFFNHSTGTVQLTASVRGYYIDATPQSAGETYVGLPWTTLVDTRTGTGIPGGVIAPLGANANLSFNVTGLGGVPTSGVGAAALVIAAIGGTQTGYLQDYTTGTPANVPSVVSYTAGQKLRLTDYVVPSSGGQVSITNVSSGTVDVQVLLRGYYASPTVSSVGAQLQPITDAAIWDTRTMGSRTPIAANGSITIQDSGVAGIPTANTVEVAQEISALAPTATGWLSEYPAGTTDPSLAVVNFSANDNGDLNFDSSTIASVPVSGSITITNHSSGTVDVAVVARGYFVGPSTPGNPTSIAASCSAGSATVQWQLPESDGGSAVTGYTVTDSTTGAHVTVGGDQVQSTGLACGASDSFTVSATNAVGTSAGQTATTVPVAAPTAVSSITSETTGTNGPVDIQWVAPTSVLLTEPISISGYTVSLSCSAGSPSPITAGATATSVTFTSLTNGASCTPTVTAQNSFGTSPPASGSAFVAGAPDAPSNMIANPGDGTIQVGWDPPGIQPTSYSVSATPDAGGTTISTGASASATSATISGLTDGVAYDVSVAASNAYGTSTSPVDGTITPEPPPEDDGGADPAATVTPVSVNGGSTAGETTTDVSADELMSATDVNAISSTASGTSAITGVVVDDQSGSPIVGAAVILSESAGSVTSVATSDSNGLFAFANIPADDAGLAYGLTVTAAGHGQYSDTNDAYVANQTYTTTIEMDAAAQTFDAGGENGVSAVSTQLASAGTTGGYGSRNAPPPYITVGFFPKYPSGSRDYCEPTSSQTSPNRMQTFAWRFYILHTTRAENYVTDSEAAVKAISEAQNNYAWGWRLKPHSSTWDIKDDTDDQCFNTNMHVPTKWYSWIDSDVLPNKIAHNNGLGLVRGYFRGGSYLTGCQDLNKIPNQLFQDGAESLATNHCGMSWTDIDRYYYSGKVVPASAPAPSTGATATPVSGGIRFSFPDKVGGYNEAWKYKLGTLVYNPSPHFYPFKTIVFNGTTVPTSYTYTTNTGSKFAVEAVNAVGHTMQCFNGCQLVNPG